MSLSKYAEKVKRWYDNGIWNKRMVHDAVEKGKITAEEYEEITGDPYETD